MNQNQQQDTTGDELPVALIDEVCAGHVRTISSQCTSKLSNGGWVGIPDLLSATIVHDMPFIEIFFGVVILNCLDTPLTLVEAYYKHGHQTAYPAISNLVSAKTGIKVHEIPAARPDPLNPGQMLYGLGMYGFDGDGAGCAGALAFSYKAKGAGPCIGISYRFGLMFYGDQVGMSGDLSSYGNDLPTFYNATADGTQVTSDAGKEVTVSGVLNGGSSISHDADPQMDSFLEALTVWVRKT